MATAEGRMAAARIARSLQDVRGAEAEARAALAIDATAKDALALLVELRLEASDPEGALAFLTAACQHRPFELALGLRATRVTAGLPGLLAKAREDARALAERFPTHPAAPRLVAELALFDGDREEARAALERTLALDPQQPDVRRHRSALAGERQELEDRHGIDALALLAAPVSEEEGKHGAIYLADRSAVRLYPDGKSARFRQQVLRISSDRLEDALRVHRVAYAPSREAVEILSAERVRPGGLVQKASSIGEDGPAGKVGGMYIDQRRKVITFDDLEPGDLVHLRYRVDSVGENIFGGFFGDLEGVQAGIPKRGVVHAVIAPRSIPLQAASVRAPAPVRTEEGEDVTLTWTLDAVEALEREPYAPPYAEVGALLGVTSYARWEDLGRWYARLYGDQLELDDAAREAGRRAVAGARTDAEKVRRLYAYVVKNTRYVGIELGIHGWKPFKAAEVHRRRYGDCKDKSTLLVALLRDAGVDAALTLVRTVDRGTLPEDHATMWAFNHAITYVPSLDLFLDPTAEFSGTTELPHQDQGAMALVVETSGRTRLARLPTSRPADNLNESSYVARIAKDGELRLTGTERFLGARASDLRRQYEEPEQRRTLVERNLAQLFAGARVERIEFSDLADLEAPVHYAYDVVVPRHGSVEDGRLALPVALFEHEVARSFAQLPARRTAIHLEHPWATRNVVRYELPEGATLETLPAGMAIESEHVSLVQTVRAVPGGFETDDTVTIRSRVVPVEDYARFREACLAIDRALARKVVIRW
jgi:tetratricopeptide (TPR) repeat protein